MFKQRLLTTILLVPLVLAAIYYANNWLFFNVTVLLVLACGFEWLQLIPITQTVTKIGYLIVLVLACYAISFVYPYWLGLGLFLWLLIMILIQQYPTLQNLWGNPVTIGGFCLLLLPLFAYSLACIFMLPQGRALIITLLFLVWAADIGAYIAGKLWGRHKLIPVVSPGKTVEGALGGFLLAMIVAVISYCYFHPASFLHWFIFSLGVAFISLIGDLFISMLKRHAHIKDTGHLLPGHGGLLDRLDSLIAAAPFFYLGLRLSSG